MGKNRFHRIFIPIIHILLSFIYERTIIDMSKDRSMVTSIALVGVSEEMEFVLSYIISKVFACIIIFLIWRLIFLYLEGGIKERYLRCFLYLFVIGLAFYAILWPDSFMHSEDNYITYLSAIKMTPDYWHSSYSSIIYAACLMVAPFPFMISALQWLLFVFTLGYFYYRLSNSEAVNQKKKWLIFLLFLVPDTFFLIGDGYRTEQYAIVVMFYMTLVVMDIIDKKVRPHEELILITGLSAFIAVWRSEGIVLGILGLVCLIIFVYKLPFRSIFFYSVAIVVFVMILGNVLQKLGNEKYYGKDYTFINSFPTLHNVFCSEGANLSYEGAGEDIASIDAVVPVKMIAYHGMDGYRRFNYSEGRRDINQSLASPNERNAYVKAYYRILSHNPKIYIKNQIFFLLQATHLIDYPYIENYKGEMTEDLPNWECLSWDWGKEVFNSKAGSWKNLSWRQNLSSKIISSQQGLFRLLDKIFVYPIFLGITVLFEIIIFFKEIVAFFKKKTDTLGFAVFSFVLLLQAAAIFLVMPAGVIAYFHAYLYATFILELAYLIKNKEREVKA